VAPARTPPREHHPTEIPVEEHALDRRIGADQHDRIVGRRGREHVDVALHELRAQRADRTPGRGFLRDLVVDEQRAHAETTNATDRSVHQNLLREIPPLMAGRKGMLLTGSFFHRIGSPA
jgi:hypothetical protein